MVESRPPAPALSRRSVLRAAAWTAPVLALAVATPASVASGGAGILYITGNAYPDGIYLSGTNYNGEGASTIPSGGLVVVITLPAGAPYEYNSPSGWNIVDSGDGVLTLSNLNPLPAGETGDMGQFTISGTFPVGSEYSIAAISPSDLEVVYVGNIEQNGTFSWT